MNTSEKQESAKLILELYDLRREQKMRESRDWWFAFNPKSAQDIMAVMMTPDGWKLRQSIGYWETAAALVNHGAIDQSMFEDTNGEYLLLYVKVQPFLEELRKGDPRALSQIEKLIKSSPNHEQKLEAVRTMVEKFAQK